MTWLLFSIHISGHSVIQCSLTTYVQISAEYLPDGTF